jgi:hypothetical protein
MLKLDHSPVLGSHIGDVLFAAFIPMDDLLTFAGKLVLPCAMPFSFGFPPVITGAPPKVCPVPDPNVSTFRDHGRTATRTFARETWLGFFAVSFSKSKSHSYTPLVTADTPSLAVSGA